MGTRRNTTLAWMMTGFVVATFPYVAYAQIEFVDGGVTTPPTEPDGAVIDAAEPPPPEEDADVLDGGTLPDEDATPPSQADANPVASTEPYRTACSASAMPVFGGGGAVAASLVAALAIARRRRRPPL